MSKLLAVLFVFAAILGFAGVAGAAATMTNYCMQPPFSARALHPNVMVTMDTSGSMTERADLNAFAPKNAAGALIVPPDNTGVNYYGYFDPTMWYTYNSGAGRFEPRIVKAGNAKLVTDWDGNFLNWAAMKRMDDVKKVLIGGKVASRVGPTYELMGEWQGCCGGCPASNCKIPAGGADAPIANGGSYIDQTQSGAALAGAPATIAAWHGSAKTSSFGCTSVFAGTATAVTVNWTLTGSTAPSPVENVTSCVQVRLQAPDGTFSTLKALGAVNPGTANVLATYNTKGPGTYTLEITESDGAGCTGTATVAASAMSMNITASNLLTTTPVTFSLVGGASNTQSILQVVKACGNTGFNVRVLTNTEPTGVVQQNDPDVRWGLAFYQTVFGSTSGARVIQPILEDLKSSGLSCLNSDGSVQANGGFVSCIEKLAPANGTPLAESLWTVTGYFAQSSGNPSETIGGSSTAVGPHYASTSYTVACDMDPYNFRATGTTDNTCNGTTGSPVVPKKIMVPCAQSYNITVTDGEPTGDTAIPRTTTALCSGTMATWAGTCDGAEPCAQSGAGTVASPFKSDCALDNVAFYAHADPATGKMRDLRADLSGIQNLSTYLVLAAFGGSGGQVLDTAARNGGFDDKNNNALPDQVSEYDSVTPSFNAGTGTSGADNYFNAQDGNALNKALTDALHDILKRSGSATANSFIGAGKGQGANLLQAFFYPQKAIGDPAAQHDINWVGFLQNLWFQVDPLLKFTDIRDDSGAGTPFRLDSTNDKISTFLFDPTLGEVSVRRFVDANGDGFADTPASPMVPDLTLDQIVPIWEAGNELFKVTPASRTIYTYTGIADGSAAGTAWSSFTAGSSGSLFAPTNLLQAANAAEATKIVNYTLGTDDACCATSTCTSANYRCRTTTIGGTSNTWKLGDIIDSTAQIEGGFPLNNYHKIYNDATYSSYIGTTAYANRNFVFVGANDGMLHAFFMGKLVAGANSTTDIADLTDPSSQGRGKEQWAFIPKSALPYLRYMADPSYCHLYYVNNPPVVIDASIGGSGAYFDATRTASTWRTIVIGSMGLGGGCGCATGNCTTRATTEGLSSYFAIDVTDPTSPQFMWEFSRSDLGFSTVQPAVIRIAATTGGVPDKTKNGHWYVIVGSGPTGNVDTVGHQFRGLSDQTLKYFVLDLKDGTLKATLTPPSAINSAYSGNLSGVLDTDQNYSDEGVYAGYVNLSSTSTTCSVNADCTTNVCSANRCTCVTSADCGAGQGCISSRCNYYDKGGVLRIETKEDPTPTNWIIRPLIQDVGPVPSRVAALTADDKTNLWLYFGTGRYYYKDASGNADDANTQRSLFGFKDPCFKSSTSKWDPTCSTTVALSDLADTSGTTTSNPLPVGKIGWVINLDLAGDSGKNCASAADCNAGESCSSSGGPSVPSTCHGTLDSAERVITDPDVSTLGVVFFTSFKPSTDPCTFGGKTYIWALKFDTGGSGASYLFGQGLTQTSTGQVEQLNLSTAFTTRHSNKTGTSVLEAPGRRTGEFLGQPPRMGALVVLTPPPMQKILRIKEQ